MDVVIVIFVDVEDVGIVIAVALVVDVDFVDIVIAVILLVYVIGIVIVVVLIVDVVGIVIAVVNIVDVVVVVVAGEVFIQNFGSECQLFYRRTSSSSFNSNARTFKFDAFYVDFCVVTSLTHFLPTNKTGPRTEALVNCSLSASTYVLTYLFTYFPTYESTYLPTYTNVPTYVENWNFK